MDAGRAALMRRRQCLYIAYITGPGPVPARPRRGGTIVDEAARKYAGLAAQLAACSMASAAPLSAASVSVITAVGMASR